MTFSAEQNAIFAHFASGEGNLVIEAFAGTGKTTTIKAAFEHAPEARILYAVFNKRNQREAEEKITDSRVDVKTLHSLGYGFIKRNWKNAKPDDEVETDRAVKESPAFVSDKEALAATLKLVGFAKNTCINPSRGELESICEAQDIGVENLDIVAIALRILERSKLPDPQGRISFNDMVWLPVAMGWVRPHYNLVCIDEAQDMNLPQLMMARGASSGRVVVVGDSRQAIYGFRGAVQDGMGMMKITLRASGAKLSTTYRCPKAVVRIAAEIVPDYKAADAAPEGEVGYVSMADLSDPTKIFVGDAILSRLNAPLMPLALSLLRKNIPARIEGRDIGRQLIGMVRTMKAKSVPHFIERVEAWLAKQIERLERSKNAEKKIEQTRDIADTLKALAQDSKSVQEIEQRITSLFQDTDNFSKPAVVLSTVHKAKGLEWPRVFMLSETFRRGKGIEEDNIFYVAVTRAMKALYFVGGSKPQESEKTAVKPSAAALPQVRKSAPESPEIQALPQILPENLVKLEVGQVFDMAGKEYVVTVAEEDSAVVRHARGERVRLLGNKTKPERIKRQIPVEEIENFLSSSAAFDEELNQIRSEKQNNETDMNKKAKANKPAADKKVAAVKTEKAVQVSYAGRGERIAALVAAKKTDAQIMEIIRTEFPGSSKSPVLKTIASKRAASAKAEKTVAPKAKEVAAPKKPAKKSKAEKTEAATPVAEEAPKAPAIPPRPQPTQE